jgi:Family of unknown function (DUF5670)
VVPNMTAWRPQRLLLWLGHAPDPAEREDAMFLVLFVVLVAAWLLGWVAFHVAGGLIHLLLIVAVISLLVHFVRGRGARAGGDVLLRRRELHGPASGG